MEKLRNVSTDPLFTGEIENLKIHVAYKNVPFFVKTAKIISVFGEKARFNFIFSLCDMSSEDEFRGFWIFWGVRGSNLSKSSWNSILKTPQNKMYQHSSCKSC